MTRTPWRSLRVAGVLLAAAMFLACGSKDEAGGGGSSTEAPSEGTPKTEGGEDDGGGPLGPAAGKIVFSYTGKWEGEMTVHFADHGDTVVVDQDIKVGKHMRDHKRVIWKDGVSTLCDLEREGKTCSTTKLRVKSTELGIMYGLRGERFSRPMAQGGYEKRPDEVIAGKTCSVWYHPQTKVGIWRWEGIDLKTDNGVGKFVAEATSYEDIDAIPADVLAPPPGFTVK